jgi:hypothetical protein
MESLRSIEELNWALNVYSSVLRFGFTKNSEEEARESVKILEDFEEYEKCSDIFEHFSQGIKKLKGKSGKSEKARERYL